MKECPKCESCYRDSVNYCPADQTATRFVLPGDEIIGERYRLERRIGRGAMGQVYLAKDTKFDNRRVAVKTVRQDILSSDDLQEGEALARFRREAQAAASIQHPNTVSVTDFGETEAGVFYIVMEYVEGETLHKLLRREGTLPIRRAVKLLRQIADGVEAAHSIGILHRDLKPANIFLMRTRSSGDGFIKVGDFGLAKIVGDASAASDSDATPSSRGIIGTPEFMSPEQMQPERSVDHRADLYGLGTIAYIMLGGKTPFVGDITQLVVQKIMQTPPLISSLRSDIPSDVEKVIMRAIATNPDERPDSVAAWIDSLEQAAEDVAETHAGHSRLVVLGPAQAEVYIDDERRGSIGASGRFVVSGLPPGRHILRVSKTGDRDDERVIEMRAGAGEQVVQSSLRPPQNIGSDAARSWGSGAPSQMPGIVACSRCGARFADGVRFCGRCGGGTFSRVITSASSESFLCPRCSTPIAPDAKFCGRCGLGSPGEAPGAPQSRRFAHPIHQSQPPPPPAQAETICRRCGGAYPAYIRFCGRCGNNL